METTSCLNCAHKGVCKFYSAIAEMSACGIFRLPGEESRDLGNSEGILQAYAGACKEYGMDAPNLQVN